MSQYDPPGERYDLVGRRLCRWCPQVLNLIQYISVRTKKRCDQFVCPNCDRPDRTGVLEDQVMTWRKPAFGYYPGYTPGPDHPQGY